MNDNDFKDKDPIDFSNDYFRYGIISKKNGEKSLEDTYLTFTNTSTPDSTPKNSDFSLFGVFDGHNNDFVSKYISENIQKLYQKEIGDINEKNFKQKIIDIFKEMDKQLKEKDVKKEEEKDTKEEEKNVINDNNVINEKKENKEKDKKYYIDIGVDEKEVNLFKDIIKNSKEIPDDLKSIEDSQIKDLILFKNLFKYNNNYLYNNNNVDYIGASGAVVLINDTNVITADLGITACVVFNKNGEIKNMKDKKNIKDLKELKEQHTFNNKEEKRRIKKFNKDIDYNNLKLNIYVPTSRCFGLFKYKQDEILKEENQIISCVPEVNLYDINNIDYILLMTKGMINLVGDDLKLLIEKIVNQLKIDDKDDKKEIDKNMKISKIIEDFITQREKEAEKNNADSKNNANSGTKTPIAKTNNNIYIGKDDFAEENIIINELNNNYYKDIMNLNKNSDNNCHGKYNITCMLIQLFKPKKSEEKKKEDNLKDNENKKNETKENKIIEKLDKKEEKNEIKENEDKNKIEENDKKEEKGKVNEENKNEKETKDGNDKNKKEEATSKIEESKEKTEEGINKMEENKDTSDVGKSKSEENKDKPEEEKNKIVEKDSEENKVEKKDEQEKGEKEENKNEIKEENKNEIKEENKNEIKEEKIEIKSDDNNDNEKKEKKD